VRWDLLGKQAALPDVVIGGQVVPHVHRGVAVGAAPRQQGSVWRHLHSRVGLSPPSSCREMVAYTSNLAKV